MNSLNPALMSPPGRACAWLLAVLLPACGGNDPVQPEPILRYGGGDVVLTLRQDGRLRVFTVVVPPSAHPEVPAPVLLAFHGAGQSPPGLRTVAGLDQVAGPEGYITVYPAGFEESWAVGGFTAADLAGIDDVAFTRAILDRIARDLNIDPARIFAVGLSNGAVFTHRLACDLSDRVAGIASIAATMLENLAERCAPSRAVPALLFLGDEDPFFPWEGDVGNTGLRLLGAEETADRFAKLNGCDPPPEVSEVPDLADDGTSVERWEYGDCAEEDAAMFFAIRGGGHTWPGSDAAFPPSFGRTTRDISANRLMLGFFGSR